MVAKYVSDATKYDPNKDPYTYHGGGAPDSDPFGNNPSGVGPDGSPYVFSPNDPGSIKPSDNSALQDFGAAIGFGRSDADKDKVARAKLQEERLRALGQTIPGVINASAVDPYKDVQSYSAGAPLNLDNAKADLYNPDGTVRDTAGRGYEQGGADYFSGVMNGGGHDAVSDAYYEQKRAQAEQAGRAQREAGVQQLQQRGMYNGGAGVMNSLYAARSVGGDAHTAALGAAGMAQARRDNAATQSANIGQGMQSGDDQWGQWFAGAKTGYGHDKSNLDQNADVSNTNRTNATNDANVGMRDRLIVQNHQLPMQGYNMYSSLINGQGNAGAATSGAQSSTEANPVAAVGDFIDKGSKVVELASGLPPVGSGTAAAPKKKVDEFGDDIRGY